MEGYCQMLFYELEYNIFFLKCYLAMPWDNSNVNTYVFWSPKYVCLLVSYLLVHKLNFSSKKLTIFKFIVMVDFKPKLSKKVLMMSFRILSDIALVIFFEKEKTHHRGRYLCFWLHTLSKNRQYLQINKLITFSTIITSHCYVKYWFINCFPLTVCLWKSTRIYWQAKWFHVAVEWY